MRNLPVSVACAAMALLAAAPALAQRTTLNFDGGWRFFKGDPPAPPAVVNSFVPNGNYAPIDPASHAFKDDDWRTLDLPHDWSIEGPFDQNAPTMAAGAFLPSGVAWYRKTFTLPPEARGQRVFIEFDGVMANSQVFVNKSLLGQRPFGYVPLRYDMTDVLTHDGPNLIAVRTDTSRQPASRWYTGAGIYRHTRLVIQNPVHVEPWSTFVTTLGLDAPRQIRIRTAVVNQSAEPRQVAVQFGITDDSGAATFPAESLLTIPAGQTVSLTQDVRIENPRFWSVDSPKLYRLSTMVKQNGRAVDEDVTTFGIRTAEFRADTGFWLNGRNMKLLGVCLHHDAGALGAAVPAAAWESRLSALKAHGVNAVRTAHAPMSPEFYDVCDRLGLLVMDEAFDAWTIGKMPADYHLHFRDWWQRDLEAFMKSHRNHPSIVIWSLGNEIWDVLSQNPDPAADQFTGPRRDIQVAWNTLVPMRDFARQLDPSRPLTLAVMRPNENNTYANGFSELLDVIGQNYRDNELAAAHRQNPSRRIIGTENYRTRETWLALRDNPALAGQFLWAGVDYLGEAGRWPGVFGGAGILDHTNHPKVEALERAAWWSTEPVVYIARSTTPGGAAGAPRGGALPPGRGPAPAAGRGAGAQANWTPANLQPHQETVSVFSNCQEVELFLNGQSLGVKPLNPDDSPRQWQVEFAPGTLRAVGRNGGRQVAENQLLTAGAPSKLVLRAQRPTLRHDWDDVVFVRAHIADDAGTTVPAAAHRVTFRVDGPGALVALDSGATNDHDSFHSDNRRAFQGTLVAILRATADRGTITLTAAAEGLAPGTATLNITP